MPASFNHAPGAPPPATPQHPEPSRGATIRIAPEDDGARLDAALARLMPLLVLSALSGIMPANAGLRARRRLWLTHAVLLDGRPAQPGTQVRAGQSLELRPKGAPPSATRGGCEHGYDNGRQADPPRVVAEADGLVALYKPGGLHSAAINGMATPSVEALLADLLDQKAEDGPCLLNRLDGPTSGLLLAARTTAAAERFRTAEDSGSARKTYLALVLGTLDSPVTVRTALDTANRATTRILPGQAPDPLRHTEVFPLGGMPCPCAPGDTEGVAPSESAGSHCPAQHASAVHPATGLAGAEHAAARCTLVRCVIRKGARHQIRAHLASLGLPIVGDTRYGQPRSRPNVSHPSGFHPSAPHPGGDNQTGNDRIRDAGHDGHDGHDVQAVQKGHAGHDGHNPPPAILFLHHARIELPGFRAACPPPWLHLLPPELQEAARTAYRLEP